MSEIRNDWSEIWNELTNKFGGDLFECCYPVGDRIHFRILDDIDEDLIKSFTDENRLEYFKRTIII